MTHAFGWVAVKLVIPLAVAAGVVGTACSATGVDGGGARTVDTDVDDAVVMLSW